MNFEWIKTLAAIMAVGDKVSPRGKQTLELPHHRVVVNMKWPVLTIPERKLSYRFMAAEAYWILSGSNKVDDIAPWNKRIADFSDNGESFFGAYGPRIESQIDYVCRKLVDDVNTRQACMTIWKENPPATKDVPCTVAITASIRKGNELNIHVFMRSSDAWLGLPYDVFNFTMLGYKICARIREQYGTLLHPGMLYVTAASSHLYQEQWDEATAIVEKYGKAMYFPQSVEPPVVMFKSEDVLMECLRVLRETSPGDKERWWERAS
jgi:thymidylate synthase